MQNTMTHINQLKTGVPLFKTALIKEGPFEYAKTDQVSGPEDIVEMFQKYFFDKLNEEFFVVHMNTANVVTGVLRASTGGLAASIVEPREVFRAAILNNSASVICVHNHPSGNLEPSREDIKLTRQLVEGGRLLGIPVHDHLIITDTAHTSFAERGLM